MEIIFDQIVEELNVNKSRIVINGRSGGAQNTWLFVQDHPETYAGLMPMSGVKSTSTDNLQALRHVPIWIFQGELDDSPSPEFTESHIAKLNTVNNNVRYTMYKNGGHGIFNNGYAESDYFSYIESRHKANPVVLTGNYFNVFDNSSKVVYEFVPRNEPCPGETVAVTLGLTAGFDDYEWRKDGQLLNASTNEIVATEFGVYDVRYLENGEWSEWSPAPVEIKLKPATETPDIQLVENESVALPSPDGSVSVDLELPQGYAQYEWRKVSDNSLVSTDRIVTISEPDYYVAKVTENFGCSSNDSSPLHIIDALAANGPEDPLSVNGLALSKTEIKIIWTTDPNDQNPASYFEVFREKAGDALEFVDKVASGATEYIDEGLEPDTEYTYQIRAINENAASNAVSTPQIETLVDVVNPTPPTNLHVVSSNSYSVALDWDDATDDVGVYRYDVYKEGAKVLSTELSEATVYNLLPNNIYRFYVVARDITGNVSAQSERVVMVTTVNTNALAIFPFEGSTDDLSGNGTSTSTNGNPVYSTDFMQGASSLEFDGNGDYLDLDRNDLFIHNDVAERTVVFWMKSLDLSGNHDVFDEGGSTNGFAIRTVGSTIDFTVQDNHDIRSVTSTISLDTWVHVAAIFNNGTMTLYLDGVQAAIDSNLPYTEISAHGDGGGLGGTNGSNAFDQNSSNFIGRIDDLQIYDVALSATDIQALMNPAEVVTIPDNEVLAPTELNAVATSYDEIDISWIDNSDNEIEFQIFRSTEGQPYLPIQNVGANVTSYSDIDLSPETTYSYQVVAISDYNKSEVTLESVASIANFKFNGEILDESGLGVQSGVSGNISFNDIDKAEGSHAIEFDGSSYLNMDNGNQFIHSEFTQRSIAFWFKSFDVSGVQDIYDEGGSTNGIGVRIDGDNIDLTVQNGHAIFPLLAPISRNTWHHFMGVFDNGSTRIYIDGSLTAERNDISYSIVNSHGNDGGLGGTNSSNAFDVVSDRFTGLIDDFYVFDIAADAFVEELSSLGGAQNSATTWPLPAAPVAVNDLSVSSVSYEEIELSFTDQSTDEDYFELYRSINDETNYQLIAQIEGNDGAISYQDQNLSTNIQYFYKVAAVNAGGVSESNSTSAFTLNHIPMVNQVNDLTMHHSSIFELPILATDEDGDILTLSGSNIPTFGEVIDYGDGSGLLRFAPASTDQGTYLDITIEAADAFGGVASSVFSLVVNSNNLPTITSIDNVVIDESSTLMVPFTVEDAEGVELLVSEVDVPNFCLVELDASGNGQITISPDYADHGEYFVSLSFTDADGAVATEEFSITVNDIDPNTSIFVNLVSNVAASTPWNNVSSVNSYALLDENGDDSGISFQLQTTSWKAYNQGAQTGNNSGVVPDQVLKEYYYFGIFGAPETVDVLISGLDPNVPYDFSFVASSVWTGTADNGTTVYTIGSESASVYADGNTDNSADLNGIYSDAAGDVIVTMSKAAGTPVGYLNGMKIVTALGANTIPSEPRELASELNGAVLELSWIDAPFNEDGFNVYKSVSSGGPFTQVAQILANSESFADADVTQGVEYFYYVTSYNENGESAGSNITSYLIPNTPPIITVENTLVAYANQSTNLEFLVEDMPDNQFTIEVQGLPSFGMYTPSVNGGTLTFNPSLNDIGVYSVDIDVVDNMGLTTSESITVNVEEEKVYGISVNFSRNSLASSPWNNTAKNPAVGDVFSSLLDEDGNDTGVSITLLTEFGGQYNEGATTGDNSGVVPDNVLQEYYYWGVFGSPNTVQMKVSGLDYNNKYSFSFVGSSVFRGLNVVDNGHTEYAIGNQSESLYVEGNTQNVATIENVVADSNGEVIISMTNGPDATVGYINGIVIESFVGDPSIFDPSNLTASSLSSSSVELSWNDNSFNEVSFEIERAEDLNGVYTSIGTVSSDVTTFTDTNLSTGSISYYRVRAFLGGTEYSEYTEVVSGSTILYTVFVNINGVPDYEQAVPWNNLSVEAASGDIFTGFYNQDGNPTGMAMEVVNGMQGSNDWGATTGDNSGVFPDNVMKSFYFNDRLEAPGHFRLLGLDAGFGYNLKFFGSIVTNLNIITNFSSGGKKVANHQTDNVSEVSVIYGLEANEDGELEFYVQEDASSNWAIFNAFVLEAYPIDSGDPMARSLNGGVAANIAGNKNVHFGVQSPLIEVFPNPVSDHMFISLVNGLDIENTKVQILDIQGRVVFARDYSFDNDQIIELNNEISGLNQGIYILSVGTGDRQLTQKIVKY
ncbi:LamG-like jellyroll fold domain-containing protein [Reichenbachiella ulvae]|uniref:T9SS type A sorting domain-containing protein n=1 Tax=Reichenbachiella ulvae TaxID=2980104 RepID=A0ABT3CMV0_9BACT|nr:LamG-like jellyroll fold domain-containing protein [Reichenbachiella ulvae]MCV9385031.1 T9SS type A sorting domain-containing protein [Reichenbachiella ulvae]